MEFSYKFILRFVLWLGMWNWVKLSEVFIFLLSKVCVFFLKFIIFEDERSLVDIDQLPNISFRFFIKWAQLFFIGPESNHCLPKSLTHWLTNSCLVNLIDVTLACEDANSKLVEVVTVANSDAEDHVGNSLLQIWELMFGPKA